MRKSRKIAAVILLAAVLTGISILADVFWIRNFRSGNSGSSGETTGKIAQMPNAFTLDREQCSLPVSVKELLEQGWTAEDELRGLLDSNGYDRRVLFEKNGCTVEFILVNTNAARAPRSACTAVGVSDEQIGTGHTFSLKDGPAIRKSTESDIEKLYGQARYTSNIGGRKTLIYYDADYHALELTLEKGKLAQAGLELEPERNATAPEALSAQVSAYETPDALPSTLKNMTLEIDGVLYRLPAPLNAFLQNGWTASWQDSTYSVSTLEKISRGGLYPGETVSLILSRERGRLTVSLNNEGHEMVNFASCAVTGLTIQTPQYADWKLPGGIDRGTGRAQLKKALKAMDLKYDCNEYSTADYFTVKFPQSSDSHSIITGSYYLFASDSEMRSLNITFFEDVDWMKS